MLWEIYSLATKTVHVMVQLRGVWSLAPAKAQREKPTGLHWDPERVASGAGTKSARLPATRSLEMQQYDFFRLSWVECFSEQLWGRGALHECPVKCLKDPVAVDSAGPGTAGTDS